MERKKCPYFFNDCTTRRQEFRVIVPNRTGAAALSSLYFLQPGKSNIIMHDVDIFAAKQPIGTWVPAPLLTQ